MLVIKLGVKASKKEVEDFLQSLHSVLTSDSFRADVIHSIMELTVEEYSETLIDKDDLQPPLLFVFGKDISGRQIYIKLKIKDTDSRKIICVSFHYAKEKMVFPYA